MTAHGRASHVPVQHSSQVFLGGHIQAPKAVEIHEPACTGERASHGPSRNAPLRWREQGKSREARERGAAGGKRSRRKSIDQAQPDACAQVHGQALGAGGRARAGTAPWSRKFSSHCFLNPSRNSWK